MNLIFILEMPGNNAWNGRWSGEGNLYAVIRKVSPKKAAQLDGKSFGYNFGDGWRASVRVHIPRDSIDTRQARKNSKGFCGYDWMVDSIIRDGSIYGPTQPKEALDAHSPA